jgi:hypothetical protein
MPNISPSRRHGAGKSTILRAIDKFYGKSTSVELDDFFGRRTDEPIEIALTFTDFNDAEREIFESRIMVFLARPLDCLFLSVESPEHVVAVNFDNVVVDGGAPSGRPFGWASMTLWGISRCLIRWGIETVMRRMPHQLVMPILALNRDVCHAQAATCLLRLLRRHHE